MKRFLFFAAVALLPVAASAQTNPKYDQKLADSLGADQYGMKMYVLVMLKTGPAATDNKAHVDSMFAGHMANMDKLVTAGKLVVAGPMGKNDKAYRGIFILNVKTVAEAEALLKTDPAVRSGLLAAESYPWYGSAALPLYLRSVDAVQKTKM